MISGVLGAVILGSVTTFVNLRWKKADRTAELIEHGQVAYLMLARIGPRQRRSRVVTGSRKIGKTRPRLRTRWGVRLYHQQRDKGRSRGLRAETRFGFSAMTAEDYLLVGQSCVRAGKG